MSDKIPEIIIYFTISSLTIQLYALVHLGNQFGRLGYDGYKLSFDIGRGVGKFAGSSSKIAWAGIRTVAGGLSVVGVVFDIVSLPFDIFVVIKGAYDVHKYRTGQGTNSDAANQVQDELKEHKENMKIANSFESD